jgi:riboflavin synthase
VDYSVVGKKGVGDIVNIECDMIGKYIERFTRREEAPPKSSLNASFLQEHGYM